MREKFHEAQVGYFYLNLGLNVCFYDSENPIWNSSEIHKYFFAVFFAKNITEGNFFQILSQNRSIPGSHDLMCRFLKFEVSGWFWRSPVFKRNVKIRRSATNFEKPVKRPNRNCCRFVQYENSEKGSSLSMWVCKLLADF